VWCGSSVVSITILPPTNPSDPSAQSIFQQIMANLANLNSLFWSGTITSNAYQNQNLSSEVSANVVLCSNGSFVTTGSSCSVSNKPTSAPSSGPSRSVKLGVGLFFGLFLPLIVIGVVIWYFKFFKQQKAAPENIDVALSPISKQTSSGAVVEEQETNIAGLNDEQNQLTANPNPDTPLDTNASTNANTDTTGEF